MTMTLPKCTCGAEILWVAMVDSGRMMPLDPAPVEPVAGQGLVAFNPATLKGVSLTNENVSQAGAWRAGGATFHVSHWATCPKRAEHRHQQVT